MVLDSSFINLANFLRETFNLALKMVMVMSFILMDLFSWANIKTTKRMEKEDLNGRMVKYMMVSGFKT
jgi:hypothetical protein